MEVYNVLKNLGRGTFGTVYLCETKHNKLKIVVKEVHVDGNMEMLKMCKNEVQVLRFLNHPNIIQYFDSFYKHGSFSIVMEYATRGTLYEYICRQEEPIKRSKVLNIFCQILMGIEHMHSMKIMHRDLKSENIFLTGFKRDIVKIGDFGISKLLAEKNEKTTTPIGTTNYVAPEILENKPYSIKCDVWSLGCILFELCARERLFSGSVADIISSIKGCYRKPIQLEIYDLDIQQIIDACLQINPDERPSSQALLVFPQIFPCVHMIKVEKGCPSLSRKFQYTVDLVK